MDEGIIKRLVDLRVDFIHVSLLAGTTDIYSLIHPNKTPDDFYRIKRLLIRLADLKDEKKAWKNPHINMYYVIFNKNFHQLHQMVDLALEVRANSMEFTPIDTVPGKTDVLLLNNSQRITLIREMKFQINRLKKLQKKYPTPITFIEQCDTFLKRLSSKKATKGEYELSSMRSKSCYVGWVFTRIFADGCVYPCLKAGKISVGNIYESSFKDIWNSERQQEFREKTLKFDLNDHYFRNIGNKGDSKCGCLVSCDNIQLNREIGERLKNCSKIK
jgi:MoaA/NifB/PqqE/SkfB family radical SAM enzyme